MSRNKEFINLVKTFGCSVCGGSPVDAHHLDTIGMGSNRKKDCIEDFSCVPLCRQHHQEWHQIGNTEFEDKYHLNMWKICYLMNKGFRRENEFN
jgi:hypothetical protein|tara:strand:- start:132 stop:413 length:282 start_codon:yes stop_codon:yes gene_type:complete